MKLYALKRSDGQLVSMRPIDNELEAWLEASKQEQLHPASGMVLEKDEHYASRCWRANGGNFGWSAELAREIGKLMMYCVVEVEMREKP